MPLSIEKEFEKWNWCIKEIDAAIKRGKKIFDLESRDLSTIRHRLSLNLSLTDRQDELLWRVYKRVTEPKRLKW